MVAIISLLVCLGAAPCEHVFPASVYTDTGLPMGFMECLGKGGQDVARQWLAEHPGYRLQSIKCSIANDGRKLRDQLQGTRA